MSPRQRLALVSLLAIAALLGFLLSSSGSEEAGLADAQRGERADVRDGPMRVERSGRALSDAVESEGPAPALAGSGLAASNDPQTLEVLVVDRGGEPIPWIPIRLDRYADGRLQGGTHTTTEADGRKRFNGVRLDGAKLSVLSGESSINRAIVEQDVPVTANPMVVTARRMRRVRRRFVDAETGRPLHVPQASCRDPITGKDLTSEGSVDALRSYDIEGRYGRGSFRTRVTPPAGYVAWDNELWSQPLSAYASELEVLVPLRREALVRLTVLAHDGTPATDAAVTKFVTAGSTWTKPSAMLDGFGTFHVKGIPHFRREKLIVWVEIPGTTAFEVFETHMPEDASEPIVGTIRLPEPVPTAPFEGPSSNGAIGIGGGGSGAFRGRSVEPRGTAEVRVMRSIGAPAVGARVRVGKRTATTDSRGVARVTGVRVGKRDVRVDQHGLLPLQGVITIREGVAATLDLREGEGATVLLEVLDDLGEPLPFARFVASIPGEREQYIDEHEGVQRIDRYVDHKGQRTLKRLDPRVGTIRVYWASRSKTVEVDLGEGKRVPVRVVLPAPAPGR